MDNNWDGHQQLLEKLMHQARLLGLDNNKIRMLVCYGKKG
jgi:hypothetical protein